MQSKMATLLYKYLNPSKTLTCRPEAKHFHTRLKRKAKSNHKIAVQAIKKCKIIKLYADKNRRKTGKLKLYLLFSQCDDSYETWKLQFPVQKQDKEVKQNPICNSSFSIQIWRNANQMGSKINKEIIDWEREREIKEV